MERKHIIPLNSELLLSVNAPNSTIIDDFYKNQIPEVTLNTWGFSMKIV